jgi:arginine:ornithine antiporter/lysine permease
MLALKLLVLDTWGTGIAKRGEAYDSQPEGRQRDLLFAGIAVVYTVFMIYAGGLKFLVLSAVLYGPGTLLYIWARREQKETVFKPVDWAVFIIAVIGAVFGVYALATGVIKV